MKLINEITLDNNSKSQEITDYLNEFGVTVINNFISDETINSLKLEFEKLQMSNQPWALKTEYSKGRCCRVNRLEMNSKNFPDTARVFGSEWMENICNRYLGSESVLVVRGCRMTAIANTNTVPVTVMSLPCQYRATAMSKYMPHTCHTHTTHMPHTCHPPMIHIWYTHGTHMTHTHATYSTCHTLHAVHST